MYSKIKDDKGRWYLGTTKTEGSCREIFICDTLYKILYNNSKSVDMVFTKNNGLYVGTDIIKYPFKIIRNELRIIIY